ncbi:hypothetical protein [Neisseria sp. HMSC066H01]|jgi:secreted protein|uniref:hypothetical protein n=1 Tax=Neisseria sp. HMSC066H01 TaxID=1715031 RepID=UPI0009F57C03|nr:hypothetical protein [Neisseria sp. HMSC066H01]
MNALITAAVFSVFSLNACGGSEKSMSVQEQTEARFQLNPHPKQAYRLKIKINDAPGPLVSMNDTYIRYMARDCSYVINHIEGVTSHPRKYVDIPLRQVGKDEYEASFYFDAVQDEDYFGEGVCHWKPDGFGGTFKATGKEEETGFTISDVMRNLLEKKTLTKYYWKWSYPYFTREDGSISPDFVNFGITSPELYSAEEHKEMFTITVTLEEIKP